MSLDPSQNSGTGAGPITPIPAPGAAPTAATAPATPTAADVLASYPAEIADLAAKQAAYHAQKAKVGIMRTVLHAAAADAEAAFKDAESLVGKLVDEVKSLV